MAATAQRVPFRETSASVALDAARGLAALLVLMDHCHNLFFLPFPAAMRIAVHPHLTYVLYALSSAGREAVVIFFVLSGYLISGSVLRSIERGTWSWKDYLIHRLVRLWLVLLPALVLCAVWVTGRLAMNGGPEPLIARMAAAGVTLKIFLGNVFFLQSIHVPDFGSNRVLWSLAYEFWYYMLFPLALLALRRGASTKVRVLYGVLFLAIALFVGRSVMGLFPAWLMGALLTKVKAPQIGRAWRWIAVVLYAPVPFVLAMTPWPWHIFKLDYFLGAVTTVFFWALLSGRRRMDQREFTVRASRGLAGCSYSLYLVHYPMLAFMAAWLGANGGWPPYAKFFWMGFGLSMLATAYGYGVAACSERHNDRVRRWVEQRLSARPMTDRVAVRQLT